MDFLKFDNVSTATYSAFLVGNGIYNAPEREFERISIPGRNGDLLIDNGRYSNLELEYDAIIYSDFNNNLSSLKNIFMSKTGYCRLEDTFYPDEFRLAKYSGAFEMENVKPGDIGHFILRFDCKPQRFLKSGENTVEFTSSGSITNPTRMIALPLVRVYGTGQLSIGGNTITISTNSSYTDIDCDLQDAFRGSTNCNGNINLNSGKFFQLKPGSNYVSIGSGITRVIITPRWWRL